MVDRSGTDAIASVDVHLVNAGHRAAVAERLAQERVRLLDPKHLVANVIGSTEFAWDFDPIGPGFVDLCMSFMEQPTGSGALFLALLETFGIHETPARNALVIVEYSHFATRINDAFNYADEFAERAPEQARAEWLVQLRYGAQWLNNYPRYLIITNGIEASDAVRIGVHRWGHHSYTATGISRALFVRNAQRGFTALDDKAWLESSIGMLCELVVSPAVMATMLAGRSDEELRTVKAAFSHFAVATKLRLERRALTRDMPATRAIEREVELPFHFPGVSAARRRVSFDPIGESDPRLVGSRFARVKAATHAVARKTREAISPEDVAELRRAEIDHARRFRDRLSALSSPIARAAEPLFAGFGEE